MHPVPAVEYDGGLRGFQNYFTLAYTRRLLIYYTFGNKTGLSCYTIGDIHLMHWNMILCIEFWDPKILEILQDDW